jgi:hypothetical protein
MILNAYAVLDGFLSLLRLGLGLLVIWLGFLAYRVWSRHASAPEERTALEDRSYLLFQLAGLLLALNVASWPILYLLLQSYVPEWPGVMCVYGVTQIGCDSVGVSRFLPPLLKTLRATKPALVFASGAWFVLYLVNRRTRTAPLTGRVLLVLLGSGFLAAGDAAVEVAYLVIPKKEEVRSAGCCTEAFDGESRIGRYLPRNLIGDDEAPRLYEAYYAVNAGMVAALGMCGWQRHWRVAKGWLAFLLLGALVSVAVSAVFLVEAAAPRLLHLPYHHCPYDLIPKAPESLAAVALFLGGSFSVGWACVAGWFGNDLETRMILPGTIRHLLHLGLLGYLGSVVMMTLELALA